MKKLVYLFLLFLLVCIAATPRSVKPIIDVLDQQIERTADNQSKQALKLCRDTLKNVSLDDENLQKQNKELQKEIAALNKKLQAQTGEAGQWRGAKYLLYFVVSIFLIFLTIFIYIKAKTGSFGWLAKRLK